MSKRSFTIGTDPEFFIMEPNTTKGLKASKFTAGTKDDVEDLGDGYNVHADNVMLELNVPPATTKKGFVSNITTGKGKIAKMIYPNNLLSRPSFRFSETDLDEELDWLIGCDPDFDAWTCQANPDIELKDGYRYAGGHVHIGLDDDLATDMDTIILIVKVLDYLFLKFVQENDKDTKRKQIYGTPGRFRFKDYGLEYRSLSNFWLKNTQLMEKVYNIVEEAVNNFETYKDTVENELTQDYIKNNFQLTLPSNIAQKEEKVVVNRIQDV